MAVVGSPRVAWIDWGRTIAYIDHNGSELERARLRGILGRPRPDAKVIRGLEARQRDDGGFPYGFVQGRPSTVDTTATALAWLDDLGLFDSLHAERALVFLLAVQRPDGSWDESAALFRYNPPPHLVPGDPRVRVASTALVGYWLARAGARDDTVMRAAAYLRAHQAPSGRFVGFLRATWLAAALFYMVEGPGAAPVVRAFDALAAVLAGSLAAGRARAGARRPRRQRRRRGRAVRRRQPDASVRRVPARRVVDLRGRRCLSRRGDAARAACAASLRRNGRGSPSTQAPRRRRRTLLSRGSTDE